MSVRELALFYVCFTSFIEVCRSVAEASRQIF